MRALYLRASLRKITKYVYKAMDSNTIGFDWILGKLEALRIAGTRSFYEALKLSHPHPVLKPSKQW